MRSGDQRPDRRSPSSNPLEAGSNTGGGEHARKLDLSLPWLSWSGGTGMEKGTTVNLIYTGVCCTGEPDALKGACPVLRGGWWNRRAERHARHAAPTLHKRLLRGILIACIVLGIVPDIVGFFMT